MKKVLILINEAELGEKIESMVRELHPNVSVLCLNNVSEAYQLVLSQDIELMIVDAVLQKGNPEDISGIHFVEHVRKIVEYAFVPVILLSALSDEKMYAYSELHCYGFLEKPFSATVLRNLIHHALRFERMLPKPVYIPFRQGGVLYPVFVDDIVYVEHKRRKMYVHTKKENIEIPYHTCEQTLTELERYGFVLCARGIVVNRKYIYALDTTNHFVVLKEGLGCLELGRTYFGNVKAVFEK